MLGHKILVQLSERKKHWNPLKWIEQTRNVTLDKRWAKCGPRAKSDTTRSFVRPLVYIFSANKLTFHVKMSFSSITFSKVLPEGTDIFFKWPADQKNCPTLALYINTSSWDLNNRFFITKIQYIYQFTILQLWD